MTSEMSDCLASSELVAFTNGFALSDDRVLLVEVVGAPGEVLVQVVPALVFGGVRRAAWTLDPRTPPLNLDATIEPRLGAQRLGNMVVFFLCGARLGCSAVGVVVAKVVVCCLWCCCFCNCGRVCVCVCVCACA